MLDRFFPKSLTLRAIALSTLWAAISLAAIATVIIALYRDTNDRNFANLLNANLSNLVASASVDENGKLTGNPDLGDLNYTEPRSGWYWSVEPVTPTVTGGLMSWSLSDGAIPAADTKIVPFDKNFRRTYNAPGLDGETLEISETEVEMNSADKIARFRVMGNRSQIDAEVSQFSRKL